MIIEPNIIIKHDMTIKPNMIVLRCLRYEPDSDLKLSIVVKNEEVLLAEGDTAEMVFNAIRDKWKKSKEFGPDLTVTPFPPDNYREGRVISLIKENK